MPSTREKGGSFTLKKSDRKNIERFVKAKMGHTKDDLAGTNFLRKHGFGPTGRKRGRIKK